MSAISLLCAQENYEVQNIQFIGNESFSQETLLEQVAIYGISNIDKFVFKKKPFLYSEEFLQSDLERLVRFYQREGYLNVSVQKKDIKVDHKDRAIEQLLIQIHEGEPIKINNISFGLKDSIDQYQSLRDSLLMTAKARVSLVSGKRFRDAAIQKDRELLVSQFNKGGFAYTKARYSLHLKDSLNTVDIGWEIDAGPRCFFGDIRIRGNTHVSKALIRKQVTFEKDQPYRSDLLDKSQQQLYNLGMFRIVTVKALWKKDRQKKRIPVEIQVREAPRLTTRFGGGYGSEDNIRAFANLQRLGFLGGARRLELLVKYSGLEPYNINLKWIQPQFLSRETSITLNPYLRRETEPGFDTRRFGLNIPLLHEFNQIIKGSLTYYLEDLRQDYDADNPDFSGREVKDFVYDKSGLIFGLNWDSSQPVFSPAQGFFGSVQLKLNGHLFPGDFNYNRLIIDVRRYQKLLSDVIAAARLKVGTILSSDESGFIPAEDRFYSGGSMSVRGWSRAALGPLQQNGNPTGGKSILEGGIELRYPVFGIVSGAVFTDFGNVWLTSNTYKFHDLRYAAGFGLRIKTPIGPVRLDIAWPVYDRDKNAQIHINVGQAF